MVAARSLLIALVALVATGCATQPAPEPPVPFTAIDARTDGTEIQIRYLSPQGLLYSASQLPDAFATARPATADRFPVFVVTPTATGREPPTDGRTGRRVPVFDPEAYLRVRDAAVRAIVPGEPNTAVKVVMNGEEASLFYDAEGVFQSYIGDPPEGIDVVRTLPLSEYLAAVPGAVATALAERGVASREVLFNTGEADENPWPFVYVNLDASAAAFVLTQPLGAPPAAHGGTFGPLARSMSHVVKSHTLGLLNRPISSIYRPLFLLASSARDAVDPAWHLHLESHAIAPLDDGPGMDLQEWEDELDRITERPADVGSVSYLIDGEAFFTRLEEALQAATDSILLRMYIFDNDDYAVRIADVLRERAAAGVDVLVLIDGLGTVAAGAAPPDGLPEGYRPPPSIREYLEDDSMVRVRTILNPFLTSDHTKTVVIDNEVGFLGGMNIGREYRYEWHDMMVELHGPVVATLADEFDFAWAGAGLLGDVGEFVRRVLGPDHEPGPPAGHPLRVLYTRPTSSEIRRSQLAAIERAQKYIYVQNAYLSDDKLLRELVRARKRGVDVRVVIPLRSDRGLLARSNILAANVMFRNGIRVYLYPGMSHMKAAVFDGWACLGSANANQLSLRFNLEANIATSAPEAVEPLLEALFEADFRISPEMQEEFPTRWHDQLWELLGDYFF